MATERQHGTFANYTHGGCRCDDCRAANTVYHRSLRKRLRARRGAARLDIPHGTAGGYGNHGCRCDACRSAHHEAMATAYARRRRQAAPGAATRSGPDAPHKRAAW